MIVDKFATHICISRHTLCLIITTQFTTDWKNRDVRRRFFVNCLTFYKRRKRSCLSSLLFLPHQDERWLHFPNCLAVFITDCKRFGLPCRSSVFALVFLSSITKMHILFAYTYATRSIRVLVFILFILNYKSGTKLAKIYSTRNAMFIPT